jgi:putative Holliday junction resolvase
MIVVGMPRNLSGNDTAQSVATREFIQMLRRHTDISVDITDEAVTSKQATSELTARGKHFTKGDVDALAAVYILKDYLNV